MIWYKDLYVGRLIFRRKDQVTGQIDRGEYPSGVYVVIVPEDQVSQLEILSAREFRHDYVRKNCRMIVGLALGKTEAQSMVETMVSDVYAARGDADLRAWFLEQM